MKVFSRALFYINKNLNTLQSTTYKFTILATATFTTTIIIITSPALFSTTTTNNNNNKYAVGAL